MNEKTCANCAHYVQHYLKRATRFSRTCCGICLKKKKFENCGLWEDASPQKEERKQKIKEALTDMAKSLNEITIILRDDLSAE